jgi:hypothetical protein
VAGTGRFQVVSTLNLTVSSINGQTFGGPIQSTVIGLRLIGYISSSQLLSTQNLILGVVSSALSTLSTTTGATSNWARGVLQDVSTPVSTLSTASGLYATASSNWARGLLQDISTPVSTLSTASGLYATASSNWARGLLQDISTPVSTLSTSSGLYATAASNWARGLLQDVSTPLLSTSLGLGNLGYVSSSQLISTVVGLQTNSFFNGSTNILSVGIVNVSSISSSYLTSIQGYISSLRVNALEIGDGTGSLNLGDTVMTAISSVSTATNTLYANLAVIQVISAQQIVASSFRGDGSQLQNLTGLSTVSTGAGLYAVATSNWARGVLQDFSSAVSTVSTASGLYATASSNWSKNLLQDFSTPVSTVSTASGLYAAASSNWSRGLLQDFSTPLSTVSTAAGLFTTATSNYVQPTITSTVAGLGLLGYISSSQLISTVVGLNTYVSSMIDPVELTSSIVGLGTVGFVSSIGLTNILNSTVAGVNVYVSSMIDPVELASSITGLGTQGFISSVGFDAKIVSSLVGLGSFGYISSSQLYSTVAGIGSGFTGSTLALSAGRIFTSSINLAYITGTQGYISSLLVDTLTIGSNLGFTNMGDIITTSHSSLQINTGLLTASGTVCTPQIIVSSINGAAPLTASNVASTVVGLGLVGYISSLQLISTQLSILAVVSTGLSSVGLFTSNTSNWARGLLQDFSTPISTLSTAVGVYETAASNWSRNLLQDFSTGFSTLSTGIVTTSNFLCSFLISTTIGLGTAGYISSTQLYSTVRGLTGSTLSLSAGSIFVSSIQAFTISTAQTAVCTVTFQDQTAGNPLGNVYQYSSVLYYNSFVVAGTSAMNIQSFTF